MKYELPQEVCGLLGRLNQNGFEAYAVGGCVRDLLLGREPDDWDICTNALPEQIRACFADHRVLDTGAAHGTLTVLVGKTPFEITTFRSDGAYSDGRHPDEVRFETSLRADAARRDFTVNAMALHPETGLYDFFGGQEDLRNGIIRCVGDPDERFHEDALRILRALRFCAKLGFRTDEATGASLHRNAALLSNVSAERIAHELDGMLMGRDVLPVLLGFPDVLSQVIPEIRPAVGLDQHNPHHRYDVWEHIAHSVAAAPQERVLRWTMLLHDIGKPSCFFRDEKGVGHFYGHAKKSAALADSILRRLKMDNRTIEAVVLLVQKHDDPLPPERLLVRRRLFQLGEARLRQLIEVHRADSAAQSEQDAALRKEELDGVSALLDGLIIEQACCSMKSLAVTGEDLIALGFRPGPALGKTLSALLDAVIKEKLPNERTVLLEEAKKRL